MPCWGQSSRITIALLIWWLGLWGHRTGCVIIFKAPQEQLTYWFTDLVLTRKSIPTPTGHILQPVLTQMHAGVHTLMLLLLSLFTLEPSSCPANTDACRSHTPMLLLPITLELTLVYCRYGCMQEFYTLILLLLFTLEPSSCTANTDARRSSHSHAAIADYTGAHAHV